MTIPACDICKCFSVITECDETEFDCSDSCIDLTLVCDGVENCNSAADEFNCSNVVNNLRDGAYTMKIVEDITEIPGTYFFY